MLECGAAAAPITPRSQRSSRSCVSRAPNAASSNPSRARTTTSPIAAPRRVANSRNGRPRRGEADSRSKAVIGT